jgi:hypothetical protein
MSQNRTLAFNFKSGEWEEYLLETDGDALNYMRDDPTLHNLYFCYRGMGLDIKNALLKTLLDDVGEGEPPAPVEAAIEVITLQQDMAYHVDADLWLARKLRDDWEIAGINIVLKETTMWRFVTLRRGGRKGE